MEAEGWPILEFERFEGEPAMAHRRRSAEILEIMEGFRMGRFRGEEAESMEHRLIKLQEQSPERMPA